MKMREWKGALLLAALGSALLGCSGEGDDSPSTSGGEGDGDGSESVTCESDTECTDGVFCNGEERCNPDHDDADAFGCIEARDEPCSAGSSCHESSESCGCEEPDSDGDGHVSVMCEVDGEPGDDCDDDDPNRYPGNTEVCVAGEGRSGFEHDEDCDPNTFGTLDADGDEETDLRCCNEDASGDATCGTDCDDDNANRYPGNTEACDDIDNDCDDLIDENPDGEADGLKVLYTVDADGDGFGSDDPDAATILSCDPPTGFSDTPTDCNDLQGDINPAAVDSCNDNIDNDCSGIVNDIPGGCDCEGNESQSCGLSQEDGGLGLLGLCGTFNRQCNDGTWDDCPRLPLDVPEVCDPVGVDEDCDGNVDNVYNDDTDFSLRTMCYVDEDDDNFAASTSGAELRCDCMGDWTETEPTDASNTDCSDDPDTDSDAAERFPGNSEQCNGIDNDCDSVPDNDATDRNTYYEDTDGDGFGDPNSSVLACTLPDDYSESNNDCNDGTAAIASVAECSPSPASGTTYACNTGACEIEGCPTDQGDCNSDHTDHCETDLSSSMTHCGGCSNSGYPGGGESCHLICLNSACDDIVDVETGGSHACGIRENGGVVCWGDNSRGQLGDGTTTTRSEPVEVSVVSNVVALSLGAAHTCAVQSDGTPYCWGDNTHGQTGRSPTATPQTLPQTVAIADVDSISAGGEHTCAIADGGDLWCWGRNGVGQLGNDSSADSSNPREVLQPGQTNGGSQVTNAISLSAGGDFSCAVRVDYSTICWGLNGSRQLGDGSSNHGDSVCLSSFTDCSRVPVQISGGHTALEVSAGRAGTHACIRTATDVLCWGFNTDGRALGTTSSAVTAPTSLSLGNPALQVSAGTTHTCARLNTGDTQCWGSNSNGQLGRGAVGTGSFTADDVSLADAGDVAAGNTFSCAVRTSGATVCWGADGFTQLGNGNPASDLDAPDPVSPLTL